MPSNMFEFIFCAVFLIIGAFVEAYIIGGITADIQKSQDEKTIMDKKLEYAKYSMEIHKFPGERQHQIYHYMNRKQEIKECSGDIDKFI